MNDNNIDIYSSYTPLRNHLRKVDLGDSLYTIWAYANNLQFQNPIPENIQTHNGIFRYNKDVVQKRKFVQENHLEVLARELIAESSTNSNAISFRNVNCFINALRKLKNLDNEIAKSIPKNDRKSLYLSFEKLAHSQFAWQVGASAIGLYRYYKIFSYKSIPELIEKTTGINYKKFYTIALSLFGNFLKSFIAKYPIESKMNNISDKEAGMFLKVVCNTPEQIKFDIQERRKIDENFFINFRPLIYYPLLKLEEKNVIVCPISTLFYWRFTEGIYYDLRKKYNGKFDNLYGESFESYLYEVFQKSKTNNNIKIHKQEEYAVGKKVKKPSDCIIDDNLSALFIECKAKKVPITSLESPDLFDEQLDILSNAVMQVYKFIKDYQNNLYPKYQFNSKKKIYPLVVTLESWYLFGDYYFKGLENKVKSKLVSEGMNPELLNSMPFSLCSTDEFEQIVQIIQVTGIKKFMDSKLNNPERRYWEFSPFIRTDYKKELKQCSFLFKKELDEFISRAKTGQFN